MLTPSARALKRTNYSPAHDLDAPPRDAHPKRAITPVKGFSAGLLALALALSGCASGSTGNSSEASSASASITPGKVTVQSGTPNTEDAPEAAYEAGAGASRSGSITVDPDSDSSGESQQIAENFSQEQATNAQRMLDTLPVKGRAPKTGYSRDQFGPAWNDSDHNGYDTRNDILNRDLSEKQHKNSRGCVVTSGVLHDPYTAKSIHFMRGQDTSSQVQIDHVVSLSDAWQTGAQQLSEEERIEFANDPDNLLAVDGPANQQKGDADAATWLPANRSFRCPYVARQIRVKEKYRLWVKPAEKDAMLRVLSSCGGEGSEPRPAPAPGPGHPEGSGGPHHEPPAGPPPAQGPRS